MCAVGVPEACAGYHGMITFCAPPPQWGALVFLIIVAGKVFETGTNVVRGIAYRAQFTRP